MRHSISTLAALAICAAMCALILPAPDCQAKEDAGDPAKFLPDDGVGFINDTAVGRHVGQQINRLVKGDGLTKCSDLFAQLDRTACTVSLSPVKKGPRPLPELYVEACKSTVAILISQKHNGRWHITFCATGFVVSADGVIATNYHVIPDSDNYLFAMTSDGQVHPIQEVLAGNKSNDVVLCRISSDALQAFPLREAAPVGSAIRVISNPKGRVNSLSEGIISRRYARPRGKQPPQVDEGDEKKAPVEIRAATRWVTVTADFGRGSSGAPVLDRSGNVVAMARSTDAVEVGVDPRKSVQMVFRDCVPAEVILELIEKPGKP
ncbi:S1 family peptidase [Adhaeretor mobilis]|uniref:Serine protease HtrA n=1 Tax=Adhaeretor mobilis TaxID=1930276 RepID=A0A517MWT7_9BACT|nr:serine protease [Adhaeretor mobilis]QDS99277.1 Putative serine protease HtrA [Adhaeretor mobilis]